MFFHSIFMNILCEIVLLDIMVTTAIKHVDIIKHETDYNRTTENVPKDERNIGMDRCAAVKIN